MSDKKCKQCGVTESTGAATCCWVCNSPFAEPDLLDASLYREWIARHCQQIEISGGTPYPWDKISDEQKDEWRKLADEHAASIRTDTANATL